MLLRCPPPPGLVAGGNSTHEMMETSFVNPLVLLSDDEEEDERVDTADICSAAVNTTDSEATIVALLARIERLEDNGTMLKNEVALLKTIVSSNNTRIRQLEHELVASKLQVDDRNHKKRKIAHSSPSLVRVGPLAVKTDSGIGRGTGTNTSGGPATRAASGTRDPSTSLTPPASRHGSSGFVSPGPVSQHAWQRVARRSPAPPTIGRSNSVSTAAVTSSSRGAFQMVGVAASSLSRQPAVRRTRNPLSVNGAVSSVDFVPPEGEGPGGASVWETATSTSWT